MKYSILLILIVFFSFTNPTWCQSIDREELLKLIDYVDKQSAEGKLDSALAISKEIALQAEKEGDHEFMTRAYLVMASVYIRLSKPRLAKIEYVKSFEAAKKWNNVPFQKTAELGLALVYNTLGGNALDETESTYDTLKAEVYLDSAETLLKGVEEYYALELPSDTLMRAYIYTNLAGYNFNRQNFLRSNDYRKQAIEFYESLNDTVNIVEQSSWLGNSFLKHYERLENKNELFLDSAELYLLNAYKLSERYSLKDFMRQSSKWLAQVKQYQNDIELALFYWNKSDSLLSNIYSQDYEDRVLELRTQYQTEKAELEADRERLRVSGLEKTQLLVIIIGIALIVIFSIWLYILDQRRKNIQAIASKNNEINKQRIDELLQQQEISSLQGVLEGQEKERKRVAIDLHDRLGGILSMVKLHFSSVEEKLPDDNPEKKKFLTASELLDLAAGEVRNISHDLLSGVLAKFGLIPALKDLTSRINESGEIKLNLIYKGVEDILTGEQELQIYRITQEMISNILKHSEAKEATIQLLKNENENSVNLLVEDDGQGFDPEENKSDGIGLTNLKARVEKLKGDLHIDSGRGVGTSISIDIPIEND